MYINVCMHTHLEVARDHEQRALEDGLHYPRHVLLHRLAELLDGGGEQRQHLGIPSAGDIPLKIYIKKKKNTTKREEGKAPPISTIIVDDKTSKHVQCTAARDICHDTRPVNEHHSAEKDMVDPTSRRKNSSSLPRLSGHTTG